MPASAKIYLAVMATVGWFALVAQFYINATLNLTPVPEMIIRFFSYFTIQTNCMVAVSCTILLLVPSSKLGNFFSRQQTMAAITVYVVIVGLIYNTILRFLWNPQGLQELVDELLHSVIPVLAVIYWLLFAGKDQLRWTNIFYWLIFPFAYIIYVLIRGSISGFYPYPFINTTLLGLNKVLVNALGIAVIFTIISLLFVAAGRSLSKNQQK